MSTRLIALLGPDESRETRQFRGFPPDLTEGVDHREALPLPRVLLVEEKSDGVFLFRFTDDGTCVGDTWHMSMEEAKDQARKEYGTESTEWKEVPEATGDPVTYALKGILNG
jgi:hypothetical protein